MRNSYSNYIKVKVVVADEHEIILEGIKSIIQTSEKLQFEGAFLNASELIKSVSVIKPDVVLLSLSLPDIKANELIKQLHDINEEIGVIGLSTIQVDLVKEILQAGALGYIVNTISKKELLKAIYTVADKNNYYCTTTNQRIASLITKGVQKEKKQFTDREREIISMICDGLSSKQIAGKLHLQPRTIERYRDEIMRKMAVKNVAGVVSYAAKFHLCDL